MNPPIEHRQRFPKGRRGKFRQTFFQIRPRYPGQIAGFHIARALRRLFFQEISRQLGRGVKIINGKRKGRFELEFYGQEDLQRLLELLSALPAEGGTSE